MIVFVFLWTLYAWSGGETFLIEDFSSSTAGEFPKGWGWLDGTSVKKISEAKKGQIPYVIMEEAGNKYLHVDATNKGITIVSDKKWNIKKYPCLSWRWRVHQFPTAANEKSAGRRDSPASIYITYYVSFFGVPRSVKYIWSNELPLCDIFQKEGLGTATQVVIQSGTSKPGTWIVQEINIYALYKKIFKENPPDEIVGIAIRSDSDGTDSRVVADYDDFVAKQACTSDCN